MLCCAHGAGAAILHVGADWPGSPYATIQAAVDGASDGDEIWVEQGTYTLDATIDIGKAISLYGGFTGSETSRYQRNWTTHPTIIDGNNSVRCFLVYNTITMDGFTITKGDTVNNDPTGLLNGPGIWNGKSTTNYPSDVPGYLTLSNCIISNTNSGKHGAIFNDSGTLTLTDCTFSGNTCVNKGGAITNYGSDMTITRCTFSGNYANNGGAVTFPNTAGTPSATANNVITDCVFSQNASLQDGGAIIGDGNLSLTRCVFDRNTSTRYGTISMRGDTGFSAVLTNCIFSSNTAKFGVALCINGTAGALGVVTAMNCTFAGNTLVSGGKGGVIYTTKQLSNGSTVFTVINSILWGNGGNALDRSGTTQPLPLVSYTDIDQSGYAGSSGNITSEPLFSGPADYHLQQASPCIDNGTSAGAPSTDIAETSRPQGTGYDIGAYEYVPPAPTTTTTTINTSSTTTTEETTTTTSISTSSTTTSIEIATTTSALSTTTSTVWSGTLLFQFVQISDTHIGKFNTTQALVNLNNAVTQINSINPAFVLITGDLTDGGTSAQYADFKNAVGNFAMPYHCVPGDNDVTQDGVGTVAIYRSVLGDDYYAFDYGGFKFIGLNFFNTDNFTLDATQRQWLEARLEEGEPAIIFGHLPLLDYYDNSTIPGAEDLLALLDTYDAPLYMNGHTHSIKECIKNGTGFVWCKNLFSAQMGDPYNLYKVYADRIMLYHVDLRDGSQTYAWTLCMNGICSDDTNSTTTTTTSIPTSSTTTTEETTTTTVIAPTTTTSSIPASTSTSVSSTTTADSTTTSVPATILHAGADWPGSPYATIQAAVDAASDGDEIWVEQGSYTLAATIDISKAISLYGGFTGSETSREQRDWNAHATIVDGNNSVRCFQLQITSTGAATIDGFTITKGNTNLDSTNGAGIANGIENGTDDGGHLTLANCIISRNSSGKHGAVSNEQKGNLTVTNCTFTNNTAVNRAAAINHNDGAASLTVTGSTFSENSANNAGAIYVKSTTTAASFIACCVFSKNSSGEDGAAILADHDITIIRCTFDQNSSARYGTFGSRGNNSAVFINCVFSRNTAKFGGGICLNGGGGFITGTVKIMNCTFTGNTLLSGGRGGAIYTINNGDSSSLFTVTNSILWGNGGNAIDRSGITQLLPAASYTDIDNNTGYAGRNGNIKSDPLFAGSGDYHLQGASPGINTGTSADAPSTDIEGTSRPQGAGYDMGAYEYSSPPSTTTTTTITPSSTTTTEETTTTAVSTAPSTTSSLPVTTTTTSTKSKLCPAEIIFENEPATLDLLRRFRDRVLSRTPEGRRWTALYYRNADVIAGLLENSTGLRRQSRAAVERLLPYIGQLADGKAVDRRHMRRDARTLIDLYRKEIGADAGLLHSMMMDAAKVSTSVE